jgi:hypothetical protein
LCWVDLLDKRPNLSSIGNNIISWLSVVYPEILFSVYFNIITTEEMASTPRQQINDALISMDKAVSLSKLQKNINLNIIPLFLLYIG